MGDFILSFSQIRKKDVGLAGGKGANLGELKAAGFPVPGGFCVTTESYKEFISSNRLEDFIIESLKELCPDNAEKISAVIRERINNAKMPPEIKRNIITALAKAGMDDFYAVRSSATAEDSKTASFAGQYDTYLNRKSEEDILKSVQDCWASLFTERALLYRMKNSILNDQALMSVVIQKMVYPDASGILFTADPVSGNREECIVEAGYGLGEALVGGLIRPDIYKVNKRTGLIADKRLEEKDIEICPVPEGGTQARKIEGEKRSGQVLPDGAIRELARIGIKIEAHFGMPQDIEWCFAAGRLFVVQSRAITSLFPLPEPLPKDGSLHVYVSFGHIQMNTKPLSPLGISTLRLILPFDRAVTKDDDYTIFKTAAGRAYVDVTTLLKIPPARKIIPIAIKNMDFLIGRAMQQVICRKDFRKRLPSGGPINKGLVKTAFPVAARILKKIVSSDTSGLGPVYRYISDRKEKLEHSVANAAIGKERLDILRDGIFIGDGTKALIPPLVLGVISYKQLEKLTDSIPGAPQLVNMIVQGLEGNITTEMGLLIGDIADMARNDPVLLAELENPDYKTLSIRIGALHGQEGFKNMFSEFINKFGMRSAGEIDIAVPRWSENPEALVNTILSIIETAEPGAHRAEYEGFIKRGKQAACDLVALVMEKEGRRKARQAQKWANICRAYMPGREYLKYFIVQCLMLSKNCFLELGEQLVLQRRLEKKEDVFYLYYWELYDSLNGSEDLKGKVAARKDAYRLYNDMNAPRLLTSDGEEITASYEGEGLPDNALPGIPASSGVAEGVAKVVVDPAKESIDKGEILIAPFTDPGWTPLFVNAAGLATEIGGLMTHGAVIAREYGIPAVVGVSGLTAKIKTGQKVRIDGNSGHVEILEEI